jgi:hypothetical protein
MIRHRIFSYTTAAIAAAAVSVPASAAASGATSNLRPDAAGAFHVQRSVALTPDAATRSSAPAIGPVVTPDAADPSRAPGSFGPPPIQVVKVTPASGNGFDWGDAGIGAGGALAIVLVGLGGTMVRGRRVTHSRSSALAH